MKILKLIKALAGSLPLILGGLLSAHADAVSFKLVKVIPLPTTDRGGDVVGYDPGTHNV